VGFSGYCWKFLGGHFGIKRGGAAAISDLKFKISDGVGPTTKSHELMRIPYGAGGGLFDQGSATFEQHRRRFALRTASPYRGVGLVAYDGLRGSVEGLRRGALDIRLTAEFMSGTCLHFVILRYWST
jgi:hypothetical protein